MNNLYIIHKPRWGNGQMKYHRREMKQIVASFFLCERGRAKRTKTTFWKEINKQTFQISNFTKIVKSDRLCYEVLAYFKKNGTVFLKSLKSVSTLIVQYLEAASLYMINFEQKVIT